MTIGFCITARMGSKRLKDKHFAKVQLRYAIDLLIERLIKEFKKELATASIELLICTGEKKFNLRFEELKDRYTEPVKIFYGDDNNIPARLFQAIHNFDFKSIVAIDGDDLLISPKAVRKVYDCLLDGGSQVKTKGLPLGMNAMGYSRECLQNCLRDRKKLILETGWTQIFDDFAWQEVNFYLKEPRLRMTLDYEVDLEFFNAVAFQVSNFLELCDASLIEAILDKGLFKINSSISEEYWKNFFLEQKVMKKDSL